MLINRNVFVKVTYLSKDDSDQLISHSFRNECTSEFVAEENFDE